MKKVLSILFYGITAYIFFSKIPGIYQNIKAQSQQAPLATINRLSGEEIAFPVPGQKMIVIFWATWCKPCKIELNRLNYMMSNGEIKSNQLLAINMEESSTFVNVFLNENPLQFLIALDETGQISKKYNITSTPTILFLNRNGTIEWMTSGLSPTLEYRVNQFFKN